MSQEPNRKPFLKRQLRWSTDRLAGLFFVLVAIGFYIGTANLPMGTSFQPGSAYLPVIVSALLLVLGLVMLGMDMLSKSPREFLEATSLRPFLAIIGIFVFAFLIEPLGFIAAASGLIILACLAYGNSRWREIFLLALVLITVCILIFIVGLGQRIALLP